MRALFRPLMLGAGTLLLGVGLWVLIEPAPAPAPIEELLPLPPEPPRLADGPEMDRCMDLIRSDPETALAHGRAWEPQDQGDGARHCQALALLALGEARQAATRLEALGRTARAGVVARAAAFAQATQAWLMDGDANRAVASATLALTLDPGDAASYTDRALALGLLGRFADALADLDSALRLEPTRVEALVFRAAGRRRLEQRQAALQDVSAALALDPDHPEALLERGILRQLQGDAIGAREDWLRLIDAAPDSRAAELAAQNLALSEASEPVR
jgi:tetratricopeptide (TPR) repeat protein